MGQGNNQKTFFTLLKAGLWPELVNQALIEGIVDWNEIYRQASVQSVLGLVLAGIDSLPIEQRPPKVLLLQWIGEIQLLEQQNKKMNVFIVELVEKLRSAGICTLLVKGQGVAQCYEKPLWRSCGDVDFFLDDDNYLKSRAYLTPLATDVSKEHVREKHLGMTINSQVVELHGRLYGGLSSCIEKELDDVYQDTFIRGNIRSWLNGKTQVFLLSVENDVFYVFTHILKHFYKEGIALRQICDWCRLLWTYRETINVVQLEKRLRSAGLMTEWKTFGAFAVDYLGMSYEAMPFYSDDVKWRRKADEICSFIKKVGNKGNNHNSSYMGKYPYIIRKSISLGRMCGIFANHIRIFPVDTIRFFPSMLYYGLQSASRGE